MKKLFFIIMTGCIFSSCSIKTEPNSAVVDSAVVDSVTIDSIF